MIGRRFAALALGLRRSALGPVAALSGLTMRESVRRRVFLVLAVFAVVMLGATALLPALKPADRVPLIETWAQRAITFFGVLITVSLAGVSLPEDIEDRKIFTLLTKPLARWQLLAGRFAGFACLLAAFGLGTGLISTLFIRAVSAGSGATLANVTEYAATEVKVEEISSGASKIVAKQGAEGFSATVSGEGDPHAIWYFRGLDLDDLPENVRLRVTLDVAGPAMMQFGEIDLYVRALAAIEGESASAPARLGWKVDWWYAPVEGRPLPPRVAVRRVTAKSGVPFEVEIPKSWFGPGGNADVAVKRVKSTVSLTATPGGVTVLSEPHNFEWNFLKALASTFLLWMVVLAMTIAGSTVLSGPVNLLFGVSVFVAGSMIGFIRESLPAVEENVRLAEAAAQEHAGHGHANHEGHRHGPDEEIPIPLLKASQAVSGAVIHVIPDLNAYDASAPILRGRDVPASRLADSFATALLYAAGALLAGLAFFRMREFR